MPVCVRACVHVSVCPVASRGSNVINIPLDHIYYICWTSIQDVWNKSFVLHILCVLTFFCVCPVEVHTGKNISNIGAEMRNSTSLNETCST